MLRPRFLFEFCDQRWVPMGVRECLFESMEACNSGARSFNRRVALSALETAEKHGLSQIVELGAGRAPITKEILRMSMPPDLKLVVCDLVPNISVYRDLERENPGVVFPIYRPTDLLQPLDEFRRSVLVLAVMMHHIPFEHRASVLHRLTSTGSHVIIAEPILRSPMSIAMALLSWFIVVALPITQIRRPGTVRRMLWCWLIPIAPYMFAWDGLASCLRQWTVKEWQETFRQLTPSPGVGFDHGKNSLTIRWPVEE